MKVKIGLGGDEPAVVDLFLLDVFLRDGSNGLEIAKILREGGITNPICFVTAKHCSLDEERHLARVFPNARYLQKPVSPKALLRLAADLTAA